MLVDLVFSNYSINDYFRSPSYYRGNNRARVKIIMNELFKMVPENDHFILAALMWCVLNYLIRILRCLRYYVICYYCRYFINAYIVNRYFVLY